MSAERDEDILDPTTELSALRTESPEVKVRKQAILAVRLELDRRNKLRVIQEHYTGKLGVLSSTGCADIVDCARQCCAMRMHRSYLASL